MKARDDETAQVQALNPAGGKHHNCYTDARKTAQHICRQLGVTEYSTDYTEIEIELQRLTERTRNHFRKEMA